MASSPRRAPRQRADQGPVRDQRAGPSHTPPIGNTSDAFICKMNDGQHALEAYGISSDGFEIPPPDGEMVEVRPRLMEWRESNTVADACYEYFTEDLMWSQEYEDLLDRLADEVFHISFLNRRALAGLHEYLAASISDLNVESLREAEESDVTARPLAKLFAADGRLKRVAIPMWAKRAIYFREHGKCAACRRDVTGLLDAIPSEQYDHVVPLA